LTTRTQAPTSWRPASGTAPSGSATSAPPPRVRVYIGSRRPAPAVARPLTSEEAAAALTAYARAHPRAWAALQPVFENTLGARIDSNGTSLPLIALDLACARPGATP
jgi:hypothetical protein